MVATLGLLLLRLSTVAGMHGVLEVDVTAGEAANPRAQPELVVDQPPVAAAAAPAPLVSAEHVQHFGWYHDLANETAGFSTLNFRVETAAEAVALTQQTGNRCMLDAYVALWKRNETTKHLYLRPDYKATVAKLAAAAKPLLDNTTIIGFNLGDEMSWSCLPPDQLSTGADELRSHFPRGSAVIWYNEASGPLDPTSRWRVPRPWGPADCPEIKEAYHIPKSLDWFSVDIYRALSNQSKWVASAVKSFYEAQIFPHLSSEQKVVLIPGSFGCNESTTTCDERRYDEQCAQDAHDFIAWAQADTSVVAVFPWHWADCPKCDPNQSSGTSDMPVTRAVC